MDDKAINVLNDPSFISEPYSEGLWIKGLAFYRKGDFQTASRQFLILSKITSSKWLSNAGAYWSFLSSTKDANDNITFQASLDALNTACEPSFNIYSILSCRILDKPIKDNVFDDIEMKKDLGFFLDTDFGRRIQALVEIGELPVAELELNRLQGRSNDRFKRVILGFAIKNDLSSMQIKTAKYLFEDKAPIQFLYPTPKWIVDFEFNNIDPTIALSMIRQESQFSAFAKSGKSAYGLMQILPSTARMVNKEHNFKSNPRILFDPKINVETGTKYIESLLEIGYIEGDLLKALISYNAGPGNLSKWMKKTNFNNDSFLLIESIPSRETRIFVERVLTNLVIYELINHNSFNYADELIESNTNKLLKMINESIPFKQINISVITISDTRNKDTDKSGAYLIKAIKEKKHSCEDYEIISDDPNSIIKTIKEKSLNKNIDVIITTGGTGLTGRDNTSSQCKKYCRNRNTWLWRAFQTTELPENWHLNYSIFSICIFGEQKICLLSPRLSFSRQRCLE